MYGGMQVDRLWVSQLIEEFGRFGAGGQGIFRPAFAAADRAARDFAVTVMREAGLTVTMDEAGNIIGRLAGTDQDAPAVATGSHLDTVPGAGRYDGVAGVVAGLASVRRLQACGPLRHPVEVIVFAAATASRFPIHNLGSKLMAGLGQAACYRRLTDENGETLAQAIQQAAAGWNLRPVRRQRGDLKAFVELHVEQGDTLTATGARIGVASLVASHTCLKITVRGCTAHAGTTPMEKRRDALVSAAMIIMAVEEVAVAQERHGTVCTVGALRTHGAAVSTVPGLVEMWVDIRGTEQEGIVYALQEIKDAASTIADGQDTPIDIDVLSSDKPVRLDGGICQLLEETSAHLGFTARRLPCLAAHDVIHMAALAPSGLLLIPSRGGISYHPDECSDLDNIMAGIDVLTAALYELAR